MRKIMGWVPTRLGYFQTYIVLSSCLPLWYSFHGLTWQTWFGVAQNNTSSPFTKNGHKQVLEQFVYGGNESNAMQGILCRFQLNGSSSHVQCTAIWILGCRWDKWIVPSRRTNWGQTWISNAAFFSFVPTYLCRTFFLTWLKFENNLVLAKRTQCRLLVGNWKLGYAKNGYNSFESLT